MTIVAKISQATEYRTGWAYAAIVNGEAIAVLSLDIGEASELGGVDHTAITSALESLPVVAAAKKASDESFAAYEASGYDDDVVDFSASDLTIRLGMASGGEFTHSFSHREAKSAGMPKAFQ